MKEEFPQLIEERAAAWEIYQLLCNLQLINSRDDRAELLQSIYEGLSELQEEISEQINLESLLEILDD